MTTTAMLERQRARAVAEEYRSKGYQVIEEPSHQQLPDFLSGYQPDLLVQKGNEMLVVEVKTRSSLAKDSQFRELTQLLRERPGWSFELILVREEEKLDLPESTHLMEEDDVPGRVEEAERLLESGYSESALLLAWSDLEAAMRLLIEREGISLDHFTSAHILSQAVFNGVISRSDYNSLTSAMKYRNAFAHGFKTPDFDPAIVRSLINVTREVLHTEQD